MILIKLAPDFDKSTLNPNLEESKIWFDEMAEQLYNSKLEVEKKKLRKRGYPKSGNQRDGWTLYCNDRTWNG